MLHRRGCYGLTYEEGGWIIPQSGQSDKLFLKSLELGLPHPLARRRVCPPGSASGRGEWGVPIPTTVIQGGTLCMHIVDNTYEEGGGGARVKEIEWEKSLSYTV